MPGLMISRLKFLLGMILPIAFLICTPSAEAGKDSKLRILFIGGILNDVQGNYDNWYALVGAISDDPRSVQYAQKYRILYDNIVVAGDTVADLTQSKLLEEYYIESVVKGFKEGSSVPAIVDPSGLRVMYEYYLGLENKVVRDAVSIGVPKVQAALDNNETVIIVAHSHGNVIANYIFAGISTLDKGTERLSKLRIVNVGSVSLLSTHNFTVNLVEDEAINGLMTNVGVTRTTPYCHSNGNATTCGFRVLPGTVTVDGFLNCFNPTNNPLCHSFVATYLSSSLIGTAILGQRFSSTTAVTTGSGMRNFVLDTVFSAIDSITGQLPTPTSLAELGAKYWKRGSISSDLPGSFTLNSTGTYIGTSALFGRTEYDQGVSLSMQACLAPTVVSYNAIFLADVAMKNVVTGGSLPSAAPYIGAHTRWEMPTMLGLYDGVTSRYFSPTPKDGKFCGTYAIAVCPDGTGAAQFVNDVPNSTGGRSVYTVRSSSQLPATLRRLLAYQYYDSSSTISGLTETDYPFPAPFPSVVAGRPPAVCNSRPTP